MSSSEQATTGYADVGASMGGGIAIDFALDYPDMVSALVLVGSGLSGSKPYRGR